MLNDLKILNGNMPLKFDPLNNIYTIDLDQNETELKLEYKVSEGATVKIENNHDLQNGLNEVNLIVTKDDKETIYNLYVYKDDTTKVNKSLEEMLNVKLEPKEELPNYVAPLIGVICFLLIITFYLLLFRKSKKH